MYAYCNINHLIVWNQFVIRMWNDLKILVKYPKVAGINLKSIVEPEGAV